jgi:hypothetical protein
MTKIKPRTPSTPISQFLHRMHVSTFTECPLLFPTVKRAPEFGVCALGVRKGQDTLLGVTILQTLRLRILLSLRSVLIIYQ